MQATGVKFERIALFRRRHRPSESLPDFHAALSKMISITLRLTITYELGLFRQRTIQEVQR